MLRQLHAFSKQTMQVWSRSVPAVKFNVRPAQVIRDDKDKVGLLCGNRKGRAESQKKQGYVFDHVDTVKEASEFQGQFTIGCGQFFSFRAAFVPA